MRRAALGTVFANPGTISFRGSLVETTRPSLVPARRPDGSNHSREERKAPSQAISQSARLQLLLDIHGILVSALDMRKLLSATSDLLRPITRHCYSRLLLYDPLTTQLKTRALDFPHGKGLIHEGLLVPLLNCAEGYVYTKRKPLIVHRLETTSFPSEVTRRLLDEGVLSLCMSPLMCRDRILGLISLESETAGAFTESTLSLLTEISKPLSLAIENELNFERISALDERLTKEKLYLKEQIAQTQNGGGVVGSSPAILRVLEKVKSVAPFDSNVLITGETGTGKELVAKAIHKFSPRRDRPFVKVDCASIPAGLMESELFGHQKGAYTNAYTDRIGRLELAHQGTIFLDEIGDLPLELQPKLLRALQDHEFDRLGGNKSVEVDVRLIAATNRNLARMVEEGNFRGDLYFRLNVFPIVIPPLRERRRDIPLLARYFMHKFARKMSKRLDTISPHAMHALLNWTWPGNVRELENVVERAVILSQDSTLELPALELGVQPHRDPGLCLFDDALIPRSPGAEREIILRVLEDTNWVVGTPSGAAARLGLKRTTLHARMKRLGITRCCHGDDAA
jgi:formate hydrogenlyase transcriptional activator